MKKYRHRINFIEFILAGLFGLISAYLLFGGTVWGDPVTPQGIIDQISNLTATGQIYDKAASDDLTTMVTTVNTFIKLGDKFTAKSLLAGFISTVQGMTDKLMTSTAATSLTDSANSLSSSL